MKSLYALLLEKISRDIAISTAIGVTAGMRAAIIDAKNGQSIESRVDQELDAVFEELLGAPTIGTASVPSIETVAGSTTVVPKRGPGRPRKSPYSGGSS